MHINDSKKILGSRVDRHDQIGKGFIGIDTFRMIMNDPRMNDIPLILETPDDKLWKEEIEMLYGMVSNEI
jgi:deoxyribonuclease-4